MYISQSRIHQRRLGFDAIFPGVVFIITLAIFLAIFVTQSEFFKVRQVNVKGSDSKLNLVLSTYLKEKIPYLFSSRSQLLANLVLTFPQVKSASLELDIFNRALTAFYTLRTAHFLWCGLYKQDCYLIDRDGIIFTKSELTEASFLMNVKDSYFKDIAIGKRVPATYLTALVSIERVLSEKSLPLKEFRIEAPFAIKALLRDAPELRFTLLEKSIQEQVQRFSLFYDSLVKEEFSKLEYVDLRVKNRIYYK